MYISKQIGVQMKTKVLTKMLSEFIGKKQKYISCLRLWFSVQVTQQREYAYEIEVGIRYTKSYSKKYSRWNNCLNGAQDGKIVCDYYILLYTNFFSPASSSLSCDQWSLIVDRWSCASYILFNLFFLIVWFYLIVSTYDSCWWVVIKTPSVQFFVFFLCFFSSSSSLFR